MNEEEQIVDIWNLFKPYLDKKHLDTSAEKFVDYLVDIGTYDETLTSCLGNSQSLDNAIHYYLDIEDDLRADEDIDNQED